MSAPWLVAVKEFSTAEQMQLSKETLHRCLEVTRLEYKAGTLPSTRGTFLSEEPAPQGAMWSCIAARSTEGVDHQSPSPLT